MNYYKFYAIIRDKFDLFLERRLIVSLQQFERKSLQEINQSIDVPKGSFSGRLSCSFQDQEV